MVAAQTGQLVDADDPELVGGEPERDRAGRGACPAAQNGPTPIPALGDRLNPLLRWPAGLSRPAPRPCPESQATE
jgi:hypothetical protein